MTVREGAVISAYTGILCCESFAPVHEYIEEIMDRAVWIHQIPDLGEEIKKRSKAEFEAIIRNQSKA